MLNKMSDDRKRLVISIGAALLLHLLVLILIGMNRSEYETTQDFGPITVEISFDKQPDREPPEPEIDEINTLDAVEAPAVLTEAVEPVPAAEPETLPKPAVEVAASTVKSYAPTAADDSFLEDLKQRSSTGGVDARSVFGDDPVPSSTGRPDAPTAAGAGSGVFYSNEQLAVEKNVQSEPEEPTEMSVIEAGDLSRLDEKLATGSTAVINEEQTSSGNNSAEVAVSAADVSGQSSNLTFDDPALSRELLESPEPEIPSEVQTAGIATYTVVIEFSIDSYGLVTDTFIRSPSTNSRVNAAVQKALRGWTFKDSSQFGNNKVKATLTYVIEIK